jgi:hypothetical protein
MSLWSLLGIHIQHPDVVIGHRSKEGEVVEKLKPGKIEPAATFVAISMYF